MFTLSGWSRSKIKQVFHKSFAFTRRRTTGPMTQVLLGKSHSSHKGMHKAGHNEYQALVVDTSALKDINTGIETSTPKVRDSPVNEKTDEKEKHRSD